MTASKTSPTMTAARFLGNGQIRCEEKPVPQPGSGQLLIQVKANALCASDMHAFRHGADMLTPGHEAAGVVVHAGAGTRTAVGTHGVVYLMDFCGTCRSCRLGHTNQCLQKRADYGFTHNGGYGNYMVVNENVFFATGPDIPSHEATLLLDIMGTGGHAIGRARKIHADIDTLLVTGAGPIGLGVLAMAKLILGRDLPVIITDLKPYRLALAERLGGIPINAQGIDLASALRKHGIEQVDAAVDSTGKSTARRTALDALAKGGVLVCVGHGEELCLNVSSDLISPERAVLGSEYFRFDELPGNLDRLRVHRAYLGQLVTHRFPLSDIGKAFSAFLEGNTGKVVVEP
jgi:threonine 3-dehydrogenase